MVLPAAADRFQTRTIFPVLSTTSLATLESYVVRAERRGGGWVPLIFHHVCDDCDQYSIPAARLDRFLTWLATRSSMGTLVKTVRQVVNRPKKCKTDKTAPVTGNRAAALKHCKKIENWRRLLRHRVFRRSGGFEEARP